jgi:hypothetical protein
MLLDFNQEIQQNINKKTFDDFGQYEENFSNQANNSFNANQGPSGNGNGDWNPPAGPL